MSVIILALVVFFAILGVTLPFVLSLLPWLGLTPIYRMREIRWSLLVLAFGVAAAVYLLDPSTGNALVGAGVVLVAAGVPLVKFGNVLVALEDPPEVLGDEAALEEEALVLGFEADGSAKAWPFETLVRHNIINDQLNDTPVLAVFCGLCRVGVVYDPVVAGQRLTFEAVNSWRRNMLLRDRQTRSLWQQATGEALIGELAGSTLELLGGELVRWRAWRREHPETTVAVEPGGVRTHLAKFMNGVVATRLTWPGRSTLDDRLPAKEIVAGVAVNGESRAYPLSTLAHERVVNDELAGVPLAIVYDPEADRVRAYRREIAGESPVLHPDGVHLATSDGRHSWDTTGRPVDGSSEDRLESVPVHREWWFAWAEFHPGTRIYGAD